MANEYTINTLGLEVSLTGATLARVTTLALEVVRDTQNPGTKARIYAAAIEVVRSVASVVPPDPANRRMSLM